MGTIYTSTIQVSVWKEHTCACCSCKYRYLFKRKKQGQGGDPNTAQRNAEAAVVKALEHEVDMQPCPECGLYQPDMIAARRTVGHWVVFGVALIPWAVVLIIGLAGGMSMAAAAWATAVIFALTLTAHMAVDVFNPNANLESNRTEGRRRLEAGDISMSNASKPDPNGTPPHTGLTGAMLMLYLLMGLCAVLAALPEIIRSVRGWPINSNVQPCVAGPGDHITVYFPSTISGSVKGLWTTAAISARAVDVDDPVRQVPLQAESRKDSWGNTIQVKGSASSTVTPWAKVQMPTDSAFAGKSVKVIVDLTVNFPMYRPPNSWDETQGTHHYEGVVKLGSPGAGSTYRSMWYIGLLGGGLGIAILGIILALVTSSLRHHAHPTEIFVPERPADAGE